MAETVGAVSAAGGGTARLCRGRRSRSCRMKRDARKERVMNKTNGECSRDALPDGRSRPFPEGRLCPHPSTRDRGQSEA